MDNKMTTDGLDCRLLSLDCITTQEQDEYKTDELTGIKRWTSQRGAALKRGLGEAAEGKWKKINRQIKR